MYHRYLFASGGAVVLQLVLATDPASGQTYGQELSPVTVNAPAAARPDVASISHLLHGMFDKPDARLTVAPIVTSGDFAVADWSQGDMGGRALLRRKDGSWTVTLCAGDAIKSSEALKTAGVPPSHAVRIAEDLAAAEARLPPERVAMFSRFEGMVMIEGNSGHGHHTGK